MILHALGFSGRALYFTPDFFRNRPVDLLIGDGIKPDNLHDDCLGTALDALLYHAKPITSSLTAASLQAF